MGRTFIAAVITISVWLTGCSGDSPADKPYLVRVNDYRICAEDINSLLKFEAELDSNFYISEDTRTEFIQDLIQSQLLIQEAKKRKLDQRENFRRTIQQYWESTLIRDLLAEKGAQLRASTVVSQAEIDEYYRNNTENPGEDAKEKLKPEIAKLLEDQKTTARLKEWIEELQTEADIEINNPEQAAKVQPKSD
jgi:hypothetical protein